MVVCVECGAKMDSLYNIFNHSTIQIRKCSNCGCIADKYQKWDYVLMFISIVLLKKSVIRHILSNYEVRHTNNNNKRGELHNYAIFITLFFLWSTLDAYKLAIIYNCAQETIDSSISDKFLHAINLTYSKNDNNETILPPSDNESLTNAQMLTTKDQIFGGNNNLSTSTIDRLIYVFYQISYHMAKNYKINTFDCEILNSNNLLSKIYRFLVHYNTHSFEPLGLLKRTFVYNTFTVLSIAIIVTIIIGNNFKFNNILIVCLGPMHGKIFIIMMIIWRADIYIDLFIHIYVMYSYIITLHIYLEKPYTLCFAIVALPQLALSISASYQ